MVNFNFNLENFGLGLGAGWASAYALYRSRHVISRVRESIQQSATSARNIALSGADADYLRDLIKYVQADHLAGARIPLSQILVEPRFMLAPRVVEPVDDDVAKSVFRVVPIVPDHPYLHAPYNIESLSVEELDNGDRFIAILGEPGSGRTTALYAIALWAIGEIDFKPPVDPVMERMQLEEQSIENQKERAQRYKERMQIEEQAKDALERKTGKDTNGKENDKNITPFRRLTPMYAHLGNISTSVSEFGQIIDPAEPLVRAIQHYTGRVTSMKIPRNIYERLKQGRVLLLLDGLDDLPESQQIAKLNWLKAFVQEYGSNFIIITGPISGYGRLLQLGAAPVFLRPWQDITVNTLIDKWADNWAQIRGRRRSSTLDSATIQRAKSRSRAMTPFELTLKTWAIFESPEQTTIQSWMNNLLANLALNLNLEDTMPQLIQAAALQLDMGFITAENLEAKLTADNPAIRVEHSDQPTNNLDAPNNDDDEDLDRFFEQFEDSESDNQPPDLGELLGGEDVDEDTDSKSSQTNTPAATSTSRTNKLYVQLLTRWHKAGLLKRFRGGRYQFRHGLIAAYLASLTLTEDAVLMGKSQLPAWQPALMYATAHRPMDIVVDARLEAPTDVLLNNLLETTKWIKYATGKVTWLPKVFRQLANTFVKESQYSGVRERVAAALVGTRDRNALKVFSRSLDHPDPHIRRLACLGVGALQADEAVNALSRLLNDRDQEVKLAAGLALGAIGTEEALEQMVIALTEGEEPLRQAIAEAFAAIPEEGYPVLYDAIHHDDMMLRRAAVFGLRRVNTTWALVALYRTSLEDDEWYVRSAAEQAFIEMRFGDTATGPRRYPQAEEIDWVRNWLTSLGDASKNIKAGGVELLKMALNEGNTEIQQLAAVNLGLMGYADQIGVLYRALRHRDETVREAAHRALTYLQLQMGKAIPSPI
ncbi:MAG: HEAT repeat domain-containing protein [Chloroflexi bacterium]|nr:MAG: HEAT repeat domain-containing protein [Chloroflexota bacterium]